MEVDALIFPKRYFTLRTARRWATEHGFRAGKVDETGTSYRLKQRPTSSFTKGSFRTIRMGRTSVKAVVGCPRPGRESDRAPNRDRTLNRDRGLGRWDRPARARVGRDRSPRTSSVRRGSRRDVSPRERAEHAEKEAFRKFTPDSWAVAADAWEEAGDTDRANRFRKIRIRGRDYRLEPHEHINTTTGEVERQYYIIGKRGGAYAAWRNQKNPHRLFIISSALRSNVMEGVWLDDSDGLPRVIAS